MQSLAILALASLASASLFEGGVLEGRQTPNGSCASSVHVIAIGGSNSNDEYSLGLLSTLTTNITAAIPGSDYSSLPYNKVEPEPQMLYPGAITDGVATLGQYVSDYHAACPNSKIAIIGYSSGASISSLALCSLFSVPQDLAVNTIIAHVEYGPQTRVAGQPYNLGTCVDGSGTQPLADPAGCGRYIPITQSYCDLNDPQCCGGPQSDYEIHFVYPSEYDGQATDFVVQQYNKLGGGGGGGSGPSTTKTRTASTTKPAPAPPTHTMSTIKTTGSFFSSHSSMKPTATVFPSNSSTTATTPTSNPTSNPTSGMAPVPPPPSSSSAAPTPPPSGGKAATLAPASLNGLALVSAACIGAAMYFGSALL